MYRNLMKEGWTLHEIDEMDILFYFELLQEDAPPQVYADEIQW